MIIRTISKTKCP